MFLILRSGLGPRLEGRTVGGAVMVRTATGQRWQFTVVPADQCFLFLAPPTLDLPFCSYRILNAIENFVEHQSHSACR